MRNLVVVASCWLVLVGAVLAVAADQVELLNGIVVDGKVIAIRKAEREFDFETTIAGTPIRKTYQFSEVHAVTLAGQRHVLTPLPDADGGTADGPVKRSRAEVRRLIQQAGARLPDWFDREKLDYPPTLDLSWPLKPQGAWNSRKNVGQYIWDVINPNPHRWRSGIKLVHHVAELHSSSPDLLRRDHEVLGRMYFELLRDYPRAAYYFEKARVTMQQPEGIKLADCYWRLGNREMALEKLNQRSLPLAAIKLLGELGETDRALRLAKAYVGTPAENDARILAADLLRSLGRLEEAITEYQRVISSDRFRNAEYRDRFQQRAKDSIAAIKLFDQADPNRVEDGVYQASAAGYNGPVHVEVEVEGGKITRVEVVKHREKQFYSAIDDTSEQILQQQSVQGIDGFTGATITSQAIVNAAARALANGAK